MAHVSQVEVEVWSTDGQYSLNWNAVNKEADIPLLRGLQSERNGILNQANFTTANILIILQHSEVFLILLHDII